MNLEAKKQIQNRADIDKIIRDFYSVMLKDAIVGFIFTDVARINLEVHIPIIVDFWSDIVFNKDSPAKRGYQGNVLQKHLDLNEMISLKAGHFTRWLYLFEKAVDSDYQGDNAELMKQRARFVADSISSAIDKHKRGDVQLTL